MKDYKTIVMILIIIGLCYPIFAFDKPIVQTDGASQYTYAKLFAETGSLNTENPNYNQYSSLEKNIAEYPPIMIILFGTLLKIIPNEVMLINGAYLVLLFLIGAWYFYKFTTQLTDKKTAVFATMLFLLNVRAMYSIFTGMFAIMTAFAFTFPALYFFERWLSKNRMKDGVVTVIANVVVALAYPVQAAFLLLIELALWKGNWLQKKIKIEFPKIKTKIKNKIIRKKEIFFLALIATLITLTLLKYGTSTTIRISWLQQWIAGLLHSCVGYPCVWKHFFITDGVIFSTIALAGLGYLIYKNEWKVASLGLVGLGIIGIRWLFIPGEEFVVNVYLYRFYITAFALFAIVVSKVVTDGLARKKLKKVVSLTITALLIIQIAKVGIFISMITPAISDDEIAAAKVLGEKTEKILFIDNKEEVATFRAFKWMLLYAKPEKYSVEHQLTEKARIQQFPFIVFTNKNFISIAEKKTLVRDSYHPMFEKGTVIIYEKR